MCLARPIGCLHSSVDSLKSQEDSRLLVGSWIVLIKVERNTAATIQLCGLMSEVHGLDWGDNIVKPQNSGAQEHGGMIKKNPQQDSLLAQF